MLNDRVANGDEDRATPMVLAVREETLKEQR